MVVADDSGHPTILIVQEDGEFRAVLSRKLQENGYLVLETQNTLKALVMAVRHSRSIHLLLADDSDDSRDLAATLKPYRPEMKVIHIRPNLEPDLILMEISTILDPPVQAFENNESSGTNLGAALTTKVDEAQRHFLESSRNFLAVTKEVPSGAPHSDSGTRIQGPAGRTAATFDEYLKARKRLEDHIATEDRQIKPRQEKKRNK
jgi:CheY-like chemotaxis protein